MAAELIGEIIVGVAVLLVGSGIIMLMKSRFDAQDKRLEDLRSEMRSRFDAQDKRFDAQDKRFDAQDKKFDTQSKKIDKLGAEIAEMAKDVVLLVDRVGVRDRLAERYSNVGSQPEPAETQVEAGV